MKTKSVNVEQRSICKLRTMNVSKSTATILTPPTLLLPSSDCKGTYGACRGPLANQSIDW
eukprot:5741503-Karenia_brevis.AAC.1